MKKLILFACLSCALIGCDKMDKPSTNNSYSADNSGINVRDRDGNTVTPESQSGTEADRTITQKVRQAVIEEANLSANGKNVKIITVSGVVTLRGPVNSADEKDKIGKKAAKVSGVNRVDNQLEVVPNP